MGEIRLTASERESMERLWVAAKILTEEPDNLRRRLPLVKYGKRDMAMMAKGTERLLVSLLETVPVDQRQSLARNIRSAACLIGVKRPGAFTRDDANWGTWISWETLSVLLAGCHECCELCSMDRQNRKSCPLRKALDAIPNDTVDRSTDDCPYYGVI